MLVKSPCLDASADLPHNFLVTALEVELVALKAFVSHSYPMSYPIIRQGASFKDSALQPRYCAAQAPDDGIAS